MLTLFFITALIIWALTWRHGMVDWWRSRKTVKEGKRLLDQVSYPDQIFKDK